MTESCATCRFAFNVSLQSNGKCRRNPPALTLTRTSGADKYYTPVTQFPLVSPYDWCGEYLSANASLREGL